MEHLAPEQAKRAAGLLENWLTLKSPKLNQESAARAALHVLRELGFEVRDIQPIKRRMTGSRRLVMHVEAKPSLTAVAVQSRTMVRWRMVDIIFGCCGANHRSRNGSPMLVTVRRA